ncbi:MAG: hypothetical protein HY649_00380 [Acidobacteria bacterium]|nr:hypothetical protein [Acidobacteriota bacterium]
MPKIPIVLCVVVLAVLAQSSSADGTSSPTPPLPSVQRASAYLDSAQMELDSFIGFICQSRVQETKTALKNYMQKLSRLHVELAGLRIGKQERGFVATVVGQLRFQRSQLESLAQIVQPEVKFDLKEAIEHLDRVGEVAEEKLNGQVPTPKWYGIRPPGPERWRIQR